MTAIRKKIGFIGAGVMAQAIGASLLKSGDLIDPCLIYVSAPSNNNLGWWKEAGCNTTNDNDSIFGMCDVIILVMKPQYLEKALESLIVHHCADSSKIFISVLAGISTSQLKQMLFKYNCITDTETTQVFRVIPNTAIMVGSGCSGYCYSVASSLSPTQVNDSKKLVESIFNSGGLCIEVSEDIMNAVGALSGSGVAYVYVMIEAMCDGGVKMGIPRNLATQLAVQTFMGAVKMVQVTGKHPAQLKDEVCSAGGTTIAAIHAIEKAGIRGGLIDAIEAATKRSNELAKKSR